MGEPETAINDQIPKPQFESHFFKRIPIQRKTREDILKRWQSQTASERLLDSILSRLVKKFSFLGGNRKWAIYRVIIGVMRLYYKIFHRMIETRKENIPKTGAIIYLNHIREIDVVMSFIASFNVPIGIFTDMGTGLINDILEKFGFVSRVGKSDEIVEKMIREMLLINRFFGIWPEGTPDKGWGIMQGFSGFIKLYATINCKKDLIPLVPVLMVERIPKKREMRGKNSKKSKKKKKIKWRKHSTRLFPALEFHYFPPFFFPREWLLPVEQGGKSQRELADYAMMILAKKVGQKELGKNPALERRRTEPQTPWH